MLPTWGRVAGPAGNGPRHRPRSSRDSRRRRGPSRPGPDRRTADRPSPGLRPRKPNASPPQRNTCVLPLEAQRPSHSSSWVWSRQTEAFPCPPSFSLSLCVCCHSILTPAPLHPIPIQKKRVKEVFALQCRPFSVVSPSRVCFLLFLFRLSTPPPLSPSRSFFLPPCSTV